MVKHFLNSILKLRKISACFTGIERYYTLSDKCIKVIQICITKFCKIYVVPLIFVKYRKRILSNHVTD